MQQGRNSPVLRMQRAHLSAIDGKSFLYESLPFIQFSVKNRTFFFVYNVFFFLTLSFLQKNEFFLLLLYDV